MLTKNQLKQLRNEISLNSVFLKDYSNSFYIKEKTVCAFFESFLEYIDELAPGMDFYDAIEKYDNIDILYNYYLDSCIDGYDPLLKDDFIAYKSDCVFFGCVIYDYDIDYDEVVLTATYNHNEKNGAMILSKMTKNKLYYDYKLEKYYFRKNKRKYYIDDFEKVRA